MITVFALKFYVPYSLTKMDDPLILSTVNPLLSPPGGLFISSPFEVGGSLIETGGGLFNLETTMVSVLPKELEYKVEKLKYKKF